MGMMMDRKYYRVSFTVAVIASFSLLAAGPISTFANGLLHKCDRCGKGCPEHVIVERTIMVPTVVTEKRVRNHVVMTCEEKEEKYTCFYVKPETKKITKECCYLADEVKTKTISVTEGKLVENPKTILKNVKVPHTELVEKTIQEEVCTECGPVCVEKTVVCEKTTLEDSFTTEQGCEPQLIFETTTKDIYYCVKTPKKQIIDCGEETIMKLEPMEKTRKVMVNVPKIEKEVYEVEVTRMIPKKICCCVECSHRAH